MIQYSLDHLGMWAYHSDWDMRKTTMLDPITCGEDWQKNNSTCLYEFELFVWEMQKMYSDQDRRLHMATKSFHDWPQGYYNPNANV
jgi:hypothetical protein